MSASIYTDLDDFVAEGFLEQRPVPGKRWPRYAATDRGRAAADACLRKMRGEQAKSRAKHLYEIKQRIATTSFNDLRDQVYREHPDMAVNSVFQRLH
jgi:DNA-binding PadR family transcriptional regulator